MLSLPAVIPRSLVGITEKWSTDWVVVQGLSEGIVEQKMEKSETSNVFSFVIYMTAMELKATWKGQAQQISA
ncbi:hypothetical protein LDENG_00183680 [Lucifuga dentata]|nr:hypothetical protein LDENG_00183680 [Lucifuga dentata]